MSYLREMPIQVLYIEDEMDLAEEVIEELTDAGIRVVHATSSTDAITKSANQKFDCIISDINLAKGTGDTVIQVIKGNIQHINYNTPVLVASSHITKELIFKIGKQISEAVVKPYDPDELIQKIKDYSKRN
ncbi:MAG: response regulator [Bacteriovoracaceae bacterium]|nr:response regulator [Bacteriovoracaceae bacterium]